MQEGVRKVSNIYEKKNSHHCVKVILLGLSSQSGALEKYLYDHMTYEVTIGFLIGPNISNLHFKQITRVHTLTH